MQWKLFGCLDASGVCSVLGRNAGSPQKYRAHPFRTRAFANHNRASCLIYVGIIYGKLLHTSIIHALCLVYLSCRKVVAVLSNLGKICPMTAY